MDALPPDAPGRLSISGGLPENPPEDEAEAPPSAGGEAAGAAAAAAAASPSLGRFLLPPTVSLVEALRLRGEPPSSVSGRSLPHCSSNRSAAISSSSSSSSS